MRAIKVYDILNIAAFRLNYRVVLEFLGIFIYNNSVTFHFVLQEGRGGDSRSIKTCWSMFRTTLDMKLTSVVIEERLEFVNTRDIIVSPSTRVHTSNTLSLSTITDCHNSLSSNVNIF